MSSKKTVFGLMVLASAKSNDKFALETVRLCLIVTFVRFVSKEKVGDWPGPVEGTTP